ncbi:hypothetical protein LUZ61_013279 [Rhynchospora tenuis]|uniref:Pentatricopeptide repeat-containing protein n=1 Tax=Rhynchospora tenuis TaxID=198213 RepID=A0AAD5W8D4_9POAL|nr:hypothetical protein LUZ61_013279 [Rhynchospora tenuis]
MLGKGVTPDVITYNSVINGYSKLGWWKDTIRVFKDTTDRGFQPNEVTYSSTMNSMCRQGQTKEAQKLFDLMITGGVPDVVSYGILLLGYANDGTIDDVMNILDRMQLNHVAPDYLFYSPLLATYAKNEKVERLCGF